MKTALRIAIASLLLFCPMLRGQAPIHATAPAQIPPVVDEAAKAIAHDIIGRKMSADPAEAAEATTIFPTRVGDLFTFALASAVVADQIDPKLYEGRFIAQNETKRTDKQIGASAAAGGSTSAADKPGIPYLLGLALEHGAINQNINGSTLTLSSSPYALIAAYKGDTSDTYSQYAGFTRLAVSASYNLQDQNDPLASVSRKQLTEWTVKLRLFGDHSPRSAAAYKAFKELVKPALDAKIGAVATVHGALFSAHLSDFKNFRTKINADINNYLNNTFTASTTQADAEAAVAQIIRDGVQHELYDKLANLHLTDADQLALSKFRTDYTAAVAAFIEAQKALDLKLKQLAQKATLTLGYFNERGSGTPNYSVGKLMFEKHPEGFMQIDANISASAYSNPDRTKNQQTFRDATAALQFQQNLGKSPFLINADDKSQISLAFAGRYERLQENRHVPGKKADIAVANWKIEIPIGQGVSLPISITYANATELIKEQDVRGNFGITFDLDKLHTLVAAK